eukprot:1008729-Rhodomonas_salina.1
MKTGMTQIIRNEMNKHVDELKKQLQTIVSTQHPQTPNTRLEKYFSNGWIDDLNTKIHELHKTVQGVIENATEAKFQ